jgi:peptidoglycan/xylan/chitin deacetylase (PgdA/CDA1 family)
VIGVIADFGERNAVREFFELFKTPWEFYRRDRRYDVLVCAGDGVPDRMAKLVVCYAGRRTPFDNEHEIPSGRERQAACILSFQGNRIPIYGDTVAFPEDQSALLTDDSGQCVAHARRSGESALVRIGYDLFREVRRLLAEGQPPANASMPALELHIMLLRGLITGCGLPLVEIPPIPDGYRFIACLTHDVDHPSIRQHKWDHTVFGFLYRAVFGSFREFLRRRMTLRALAANWAAALKLPFVHLRLAKDFWRDFDDRYLKVEQGLPSTFFVIPFKNRPGMGPQGPAPAFRAARYGAREIAGAIQKLVAAGCEVGLHGIDAWRDSDQGREEFEEVRRLTGLSEIGVRMHWLYYDHESPSVLEKAAAAYDSTVGYNGTVGYRAGTTQAYRPLQASRLLELPLHVMDTALFYPDHLGLSPRQASAIIGRIADNAARFGGCLTVNWHDRSLAPERLWDACYRDLLRDLQSKDAWFATAGQASAWFRKRRAVVFEADSLDAEAVRARVTDDHEDRLPGLRLRVHKAREACDIGTVRSEDYVDIAFKQSIGAPLPCEAAR